MELIKLFLLLITCILTFTTAKRNIRYAKYKPGSNKEYIRQKEDIFEDSKLLVPDLITKYGYVGETHALVSPDGYVLVAHRIPAIKRDGKRRYPLLFTHGMVSSSADWILQGPGKSLPLLMSDRGYDVWLVNNRGNRYCRTHMTLDPEKEPNKFFNFSYHEISVIDMPVYIDYILDVTNEPKIIFLGHSQGTTVSYILLSERPEYNDKIELIISYGATAYLAHTAPAFRIVASAVDVVENYLIKSDLYESWSSTLQSELGVAICGDQSMFQNFCVSASYFMFGYSPKKINTTIIPIILGHAPAGCSLKQAYHYLQAAKSGRFCQYDYGRSGNLIQYGTKKPPDYNLDNIKVPVYIYYSESDSMINATDVLHLYRNLRNATKILVPEFNHVDFVFAIDAPRLVFTHTIKVIEDATNRLN